MLSTIQGHNLYIGICIYVPIPRSLLHVKGRVKGHFTEQHKIEVLQY